MALIKCQECGKEVSDQAKKCPNCSAKVIKPIVKCKECGTDIDKAGKCPSCGAKVSKPMGIGGKILVVFLILAAISPIISSLSGHSSTSSSNSATTIPTIDVAPGLTNNELNIAVSHMRKKVDDVKNITFYHHQNSPQYSSSRNAISIYYASSSGQINIPRLKIQYVGSDWLFIESYIIKADDAPYTLTPQYGEVERDSGTITNDEVGVWEWCDTSMDQQDVPTILAIINSKKTVIRFNGKQYYHDYVVTQQDKIALKESLAAWKQMGGKF